MYTFINYILYFGGFIVSLTAILLMLSSRFPAAGFAARLIISYFCLCGVALYGVFVSLALRMFGAQNLAQWVVARAFQFVMGIAIGVHFDIEDPENYLNTTRPAVFIGNHQTELDVLMLGAIFPKYCSVTAKSSLKNMPFLGWFMSLSGSVFIDRKNSTSAREAMSGAAEHIRRDKQSVYMFPEGTRSYYKEPGLLPFKKGAFHLAVQAKVPIVPVVVANYSNLLDVRAFVFKSGRIAIKVLKPIQTAHLTAADVEDLTRDVRELMLKEHVAITAKSRGQPQAMLSQPGKGKDYADVVKASGTEATTSQ